VEVCLSVCLSVFLSVFLSLVPFLSVHFSLFLGVVLVFLPLQGRSLGLGWDFSLSESRGLVGDMGHLKFIFVNSVQHCSSQLAYQLCYHTLILVQFSFSPELRRPVCQDRQCMSLAPRVLISIRLYWRWRFAGTITGD